ncbi:hypothetical protein N7481_002714 [Penicillium waksmanii]|uniref:uncharacterized protein n=1 Tax=Penicillium waksmanii TaxID=69791 RepID=UPI002548DCF7|nr:uncharacterized protein N7481_002714 [Penicillium waksmanii]KAJ5995737.1 hypothetical protein N7481_002714 [Penicillium waksmanii]
MEDEGFDRPFRFIVTGQYLAIRYNGSSFEICRDYHTRGALFYLSNDGKQIIHNRTYVADLTDYPDYEGDVFYISKELQYLAPDGQWSDSMQDAIKVQIDPEETTARLGALFPRQFPIQSLMRTILSPLTELISTTPINGFHYIASMAVAFG